MILIFLLSIINISDITHLSSAFCIKRSLVKNQVVKVFILLGYLSKPVNPYIGPELVITDEIQSAVFAGLTMTQSADSTAAADFDRLRCSVIS